jgi:hypothetical protein
MSGVGVIIIRADDGRLGGNCRGRKAADRDQQSHDHMGKPYRSQETENPGRGREKHTEDNVHPQVKLHRNQPEETEFIIGQQALDENADTERYREDRLGSASREAKQPRSDDECHAHHVVERAMCFCRDHLFCGGGPLQIGKNF